ncbi:T-lymphocyte surface antigen Ly-9 isoform X8 [Vulpes vulpes]|uniref:T-lymphocyte surface antigen Ly-9 isoform X8 n=1 Tax=Vulpes vulpes TaxID=9627 RepID=A0ABM5ALT5_VULVU
MAGPKRHPGDGALRPFSSKPRKSQPHAFSSFLWNFLLFLFLEQVQEPQVIIKSVNKSDSGSCNVTLICFVEKARTNLLYSWTGRDANASESHEGSTLTIQWTLCHPDLPYTCTARNPVSQNTSSPVRVQQFCTAPRASRGEPMGETVVGVLGESVTLPLTFSASHHIENVVWMLNTSIISKEQKEMATADPPIKFKDPNKNSSQDFSLKIDQVKMENAGHYSAYVCSEASRVIKTKHITLLVYGPKRSMKFYIVIFTVMAVIVLCLVTIWCIWKRKRPCLSGSAPTSCPSQAETPVEEPGYQELDTLPQPAKQQTKSTSDSSETSEEDQERTDTLKAGRLQKYVLVNQEDTEFDSASEGQAEYDLVTPECIVPAPVAQNSTVYTQVFLNSRGKTSVPQQKENSATIYSSIQTPQKVVPPPQQNDPESPEIPTYENFT